MNSRKLFVFLASLALGAMEKGETPVTGAKVLSESTVINRKFKRSRKHERTEEGVALSNKRRREALDRKKLKATRKLGRRGRHNAGKR